MGTTRRHQHGPPLARSRQAHRTPVTCSRRSTAASLKASRHATSKKPPHYLLGGLRQAIPTPEVYGGGVGPQGSNLRPCHRWGPSWTSTSMSPRGDCCTAALALLSKVQSVDQRMRLGAVSAFVNCGRAVAHVRGSYVPIDDISACYSITWSSVAQECWWDGEAQSP